ncbi:MAG: DUF1501 domain-containing protein [Pirellulales bacterium]|nr:DUF1501 domain-containing protein [Pirellulales bacterium]
MSRRHFLSHLAASSALAASASTFTTALRAAAADGKRRHKSAIILWMGGGPSTIDLWDLKPGANTGGPFKPIATKGDMQICEHLPKVSQVMDRLSIVRSMSTREADHDRGRYYLHTGYVPIPEIEHPSYGSVIGHELAPQLGNLAIPPFVAVGGGSSGPGFLGLAYAPLIVGADGNVRNAKPPMAERLGGRVAMLDTIERGFIGERRGLAGNEHADVVGKALALMTSEQMRAFKTDEESQEVRDRYGTSTFGRGCLLARRLVEAGVACVEVDFGGWDNHSDVFRTLETNKLPELDQGMSALVEDLGQRGLLDDTVLLWMGEFGRTPRINANVGRDHWARSWSVVLGGGGLRGGITVGQTNEDGTEVVGESYASQDLMATVLKALGIGLDKTFTSKNGRPMKIANSGRVIEKLFA